MYFIAEHVPNEVDFFSKIEKALNTFQPLPDADQKSFQLFLEVQGKDLRFQKGKRIMPPNMNCWKRLCCGNKAPEALKEFQFRLWNLQGYFHMLARQEKSVLLPDGKIDQRKVAQLKEWQTTLRPFLDKEFEVFEENYGCCTQTLLRNYFEISSFEHPIDFDAVAAWQKNNFSQDRKEEANLKTAIQNLLLECTQMGKSSTVSSYVMHSSRQELETLLKELQEGANVDEIQTKFSAIQKQAQDAITVSLEAYELGLVSMQQDLDLCTAATDHLYRKGGTPYENVKKAVATIKGA